MNKDKLEALLTAMKELKEHLERSR